MIWFDFQHFLYVTFSQHFSIQKIFMDETLISKISDVLIVLSISGCRGWLWLRSGLSVVCYQPSQAGQQVKFRINVTNPSDKDTC